MMKAKLYIPKPDTSQSKSTLRGREKDDYRRKIGSETFGGKYKPKMAEMIILDPNPKLVEEITQKSISMAEKDLLIQELKTKLAEFERIHGFESRGFYLPDDYYENDIYSDE